MSEPEKIGDIIARKKIGKVDKRKLQLELIKKNWRYLVGDRVGVHSRPTRLARGTLTIAAESASWASELSVRSAELLKKISKVLGKNSVKKIRVQARPDLVEPICDEKETPGGVSGGGEEVVISGKIGEELSLLEDKEVRKALTRLVRARGAEKTGKRGK